MKLVKLQISKTDLDKALDALVPIETQHAGPLPVRSQCRSGYRSNRRCWGDDAQAILALQLGVGTLDKLQLEVRTLDKLRLGVWALERLQLLLIIQRSVIQGLQLIR